MVLAEMIPLDPFAKTEAKVCYRVDEMKNAGQMLLNTDINETCPR